MSGFTLPSLAVLAALTIGARHADAQLTWHVDDDASSSGDGLSWATAFDRPEKAFQQAQVGDSVWVAEGHYRPIIATDMTDPRSVTFFVPQGVRMYGGFDATESTLAQRAGLFDATILDGDVGLQGDDSDNAYHVVSVIHPSGIPPGPTWVDGFRIQGGRDAAQGGGLISFNSATRVQNCIFVDNRAFTGGALHAQPGAMRIRSCTFRQNAADHNGGAVWGQAVFLRISHCEFDRNRAGTKGGAIYAHSLGGPNSLRADDCLFRRNAADAGGAVFLGGGQFAAGAGVFTNSTFFRNFAATTGGGVRAVTGTQIAADGRMYNCILWGNLSPNGPQIRGRWTVNHCNVQGGGLAGQGNISSNPRFLDAAGGDFRLAGDSPCIDAGNNNFLALDFLDIDGDGDANETVPLDFWGGTRVVDDPSTPDTGTGSAPLVDMGAHEF